MGDYVIMVRHDDENPGEYAVGVAIETLTLGAYEPKWDTFVWGVDVEPGTSDLTGVYSSPERIGDEHLRFIAQEVWKEV